MSGNESLDAQERQLVGAAFAKWKFDVIQAMSNDKNLKGNDVRVGIVILQHLNSETWRTFPSQETLSAEAHMTPRYVRTCLQRLSAAGWLKWTRGNRQRSNEYEFDRHTVADALARWKAERASRRERRKPRSDRNNSSSQKPIPRGTIVPVASGSIVPPNTLSEQEQPLAEAAK
ncbi:helix-turn-helix domain-containing protein [Pelagibacterium sp.]|uniref:helix-turn-helix domain-containing protein n=1 Tax=Pelagibacterium sp. TaxID=1967288 RepID=UPI003BA9C7C7